MKILSSYILPNLYDVLSSITQNKIFWYNFYIQQNIMISSSKWLVQIQYLLNGSFMLQTSWKKDI